MMNGLRRVLQGLTDWGLLLLRLTVGFVFLVHGGQKFFVLGLAGTATIFTRLGVEPAAFWATVVAVAELVGGSALVLGALTRVWALALGVTMIVAVTTLTPRGFFVPGYEFPMTLLGACLALLFTGPGRYAVDRGFGLEP